LKLLTMLNAENIHSWDALPLPKSRMTFDILLKEYWGKIYHFGKEMQKIAKDVIFKF
jgi:hypothetical protein